jgi:serine/threonine protein kinase
MSNNLEKDKKEEFNFGLKLGKRYKIIEKIGEGSFGQVFKAINVNTNELLAIKIEIGNHKSSVLHHEAKVIKHLSSIENVPRLKWYGTFNNYKYIAIQLLGKSLMDYKELLFSFKLDKSVTIFIEILQILRCIHSKGIIYRDIKPENFLFDLTNESKIYIIDFGLAKSYFDSENKHIKCDKKGHYTGTIRYSSLNIHNGYNHSRRDDLISLCYMIIYLHKGQLPWMNLKASSLKEKYNKIKLLKEEELLKKELFTDYLSYCYNLKFEEEPNYTYLIENLKSQYLKKFT